MSDTRHKNANWTVDHGTSSTLSYDQAQLAVLMDIRDELQQLNSILRCPNFFAIPERLRLIEKNTRKRKPKNETSGQPTPR